MKYLGWIILVIALFGCKESKKKIQTEYLSLEFHVDSIQIFYTTEWLTNKVIDTVTATDSVKKQFNLINFPSTNFDDISFIKTKLPNSITINDSILINKLKNCFGYYIDPNEGMSVADCGLPIYRDILILYSEGKKLAQIKICFQCHYISVYPKEFSNSVNINDTSMTRLKNYFNKNIHPINH